MVGFDVQQIYQTRPRVGFVLSASREYFTKGDCMKKIAVFGKPGGGKSTLSKRLATVTDINLYPLDSIVYRPNGELVEREIFDREHA